MDPIDQELSGLYEGVREGLLRKEDRSRRKRMASAVRELDLKPGTDLGAMARNLPRLSPEYVRRYELLIGNEMLLYCLNTRTGNALAGVAHREGKDPFQVITDLIADAYARQVQLEKARVRRKPKKEE